MLQLMVVKVPGMLNILKCTGQLPPQQKTIWSQMPTVLRLRNPAKDDALEERTSFFCYIWMGHRSAIASYFQFKDKTNTQRRAWRNKIKDLTVLCLEMTPLDSLLKFLYYLSR